MGGGLPKICSGRGERRTALSSQGIGCQRRVPFGGKSGGALEGFLGGLGPGELADFRRGLRGPCDAKLAQAAQKEAEIEKTHWDSGGRITQSRGTCV